MSPDPAELLEGADPRWAEARATARRVLEDPLYWFPVRHHSPNTARHLRAALRARRPQVLLMEGPSEATALIPYVTDPKTRPPVALYSCFRDDGNVLGLAGVLTPAPDIPARFAAWSPMMAYSPEYVALQTARELDIPVVFIDLPHWQTARGRGARPARAEPVEPVEPATGPAAALPAPDGSADEPAPDDDPEPDALAASDFFRELARAAGHRSFAECWDALFEVGERHADHERFRADLLAFCAAARATTPRARLELDGTLERERFMWATIQRELAERGLTPDQAFVVTGGFHCGLDRADPVPPPGPIPGTVYTTLAPYSYFRVSELSGYRAGNRAPRYYETLWNALERGQSPDTAMVDHVCAVMHQGRKAHEPLSAADAVSVTHATRLLATLRARPHATLDDIHDAILTCCCKGNPAEEGVTLLAAVHEAGVGTAVGRVTAALGRLPLVYDFHANLDALGLTRLVLEDKRAQLDLDKREALDARRSAFLHRLVGIEAGLATLAARSRASGAIFKERWEVKWSPGVEAALIERNLYGDTVESAAIAMLEEQLAKEPGNAQATTERWTRAVDMELPALALRMEESCGAAIDVDRRLGSLARAHANLTVLARQAGYRQLRTDVIDDLALRAFRRACLALPDVANAPEEEHPDVLDGLRILAEVVLGSGSAASGDRDLFVVQARSAGAAATGPFLAGVFAGLLAEIRADSPDALASAIRAYARGRPEHLVEAGAFVDGVFTMSRASLTLGADDLVAAIDELLRAADPDAFVVMLPRLRAAFARQHERQRLGMAQRVAARYGLGDAGEVALTRLDTSVGAALALAAIDRRVATICAEWGL